MGASGTAVSVDDVVNLAKRSHKKHWRPGKSVGGQTRKSQDVCKAWQSDVVRKFGPRFRKEYGVGEVRQKIDLYDEHAGIAYELKASANNTHMEFYRDVFKALIVNKLSGDRRIKRLVFVTPAEGAKKLRNLFADHACKIAKTLGLKVEVRGI